MAGKVEKLRTVRLYGRLGALFGRSHQLAVASAAEAIRAFCIMVPGFEQYLRESERQGVSYVVLLDKDQLNEETLHNPCGSSLIRIAPVSGGRKGGIFAAIGVALMVASAFFTGGTSLMLLGAGLALTIGGVMSMLSQQPQGIGTDDSPENRPSYNFNGAVNTSAQGRCVPLLYGEMIVGSAVISAGVYSENIS